MTSIDGIHHVTAFCDEPQTNYDFFTDVLGMRFVKRTVRFDVPERIYHLYYGDYEGTPGTIVTYFPMTNMPMEEGLVGKGMMQSTGLTIPEGSVSYWEGRFDEHDVEYATEDRFQETAISFAGPDGVPFELITGDSDIEPWEGSSVPQEHQIRGVHNVTVHSNDPQGTMDVLETMGWRKVGWADHPQAGDRVRYRAAKPSAEHANVVDVLVRPNAPQGVMGIGTWLHVAYRVANRTEQDQWSDTLRANGYITTSTKDRDYFHSRYITEPGGAVFEYATDGPGFGIDEDVEHYGEEMQKPDWLEVDMEYVREELPPLDTS